MGLALVLIYIAMNLLSPAEMFPELSPFRPILTLLLLNIPFALASRMQAPEIGKLRTQPVLVLLFMGFACVALIPHRLYGANLETLIDVVPNMTVYFLGIIHFRSPQRLRFVRLTLTLVALFILFKALTELPFAHATGVETPYVMVAGHTLSNMEFRIRGLGMLEDPNTYGQFLLLILPLLFVAKNDSGLRGGWLAAIPISLFFLLGVYLTGSRGALLGVLVLIGLLLVRRLKAKGAILATILGIVGLLLVNAYRTRSISISGGMDRLAIWSDGLSYFKSSPIYGIGPRGFFNTYGMTAHNSYLLVAAELGIVGMFLFVGMILVTLVQVGRVPAVVAKSNPGLARWAVALRISLGGYLFTSFFLSRAYELPLYLLLGMCGGVVVAAGGDDSVPMRGTLWPAWTLLLCFGVLGIIYVMLRLRFA